MLSAPRLWLLSSLLVMSATMSWGGWVLQADGISEELEAAKVLYQDGRFGLALSKLESTILVLGSQASSESGESRDANLLLEEAQLHVGLCSVALGDQEGATKAFVAVLRLSPARQLDPHVHAPKVIEIFEKARDTVQNERAPTTPGELAVREAFSVLEEYKKAFGARNLDGVQRVRTMGAEAVEQLRRLFASLRSAEIELEACDVLESSDSAVRLRCLQRTEYIYEGGQQHADERWATFSFARLGGLMTIRSIGDFERN